jgi:hypothetical protein
VRLSPQGPEDAISNLDDTLSANYIRIKNGKIVTTPAGIARYKENFNGYPEVNLKKRKTQSCIGLTTPSSK